MPPTIFPWANQDTGLALCPIPKKNGYGLSGNRLVFAERLPVPTFPLLNLVDTLTSSHTVERFSIP